MKKHPVKAPILLKTLLDIIFWFTLIGLIFQTIFTVLYYFSVLPINLSVQGQEITDFNMPIAIGLFFKILISGLFIYIIYVLRKVVRSFFKRKLFTSLQISGLKLIGQLIVITTLVEMVVNFILRRVFEQKDRIGEDLTDSFLSPWFLMAIGLFFILLSRSFSYARSLKQENELTV